MGASAFCRLSPCLPLGVGTVWKVPRFCDKVPGTQTSLPHARRAIKTRVTRKITEFVPEKWASILTRMFGVRPRSATALKWRVSQTLAA